MKATGFAFEQLPAPFGGASARKTLGRFVGWKGSLKRWIHGFVDTQLESEPLPEP
jgi:hypothetical protein